LLAARGDLGPTPLRSAAGDREGAQKALERAVGLNPNLKTQAQGDDDLAGLREDGADG